VDYNTITSDQEKNLEKLQVKIGGMQCSFCTQTIKKALLHMSGVQDVSVSLAHEEALIQYNPLFITPIKINDTLNSLGFKVRDPTKVRSFEEEEQEMQQERNRLLLAVSITFISLSLMTLMWLGFQFFWMPWIMLALALFTMFGPGGYIKRLAMASLKRGILNQHVLLEFAAFAGLFGGIYGFFIQPWPMADFFAVAVFVTSYHILSGYVSLLVRTKSSQAIKKLMALQPAMARIVVDDDNEKDIPIENVKPGDMVRVRSGESIPIDGIIVKGKSSVDQSLVTGESMPIMKTKGDEVIGGSINQQGSLIIKVTKVGKESFLYKIAQHIQEARALKPGIVLLVEKVLKYFVRVVLFAAGLAFLIWTLGSWFILGEPDFVRAIFATLAVLVMGYPCALGMATPLAIIRGGGVAAQKGILMRSGEAFQVFKDVNKIVFDKTGTLTIGNPQIIKIIPFESYNINELISLAASIEIGSNHPLAHAIVDYALKNGVKLEEVNKFQEVIGQGVRGLIQDDLIIVGNSRLMKESNIDSPDLIKNINELENQGLTVVRVAKNQKSIGLIAIGDSLKRDARETIEQLYKLGLDPIMITGDNQKVAEVIAKNLGIKEFYAEVLPQDKSAKIRELQSEGYKVAMVGDGINDAPALMQADIGIAIGTGTDIAIESADIILVGENLKDVIDAYYIGKSSYSKTVQNVTLAFSFNAIGVTLGVAGVVHPVWAMVAMALSVTTILLNSFSHKLLFRN